MNLRPEEARVTGRELRALLPTIDALDQALTQLAAKVAEHVNKTDPGDPGAGLLEEAHRQLGTAGVSLGELRVLVARSGRQLEAFNPQPKETEHASHPEPAVAV